MGLIVHKYGGTSVGAPERIKNVAQRVAKWHRAGHKIVVVVSAMAGETNRLIALAKKIQKTPSSRELDVITSTGEQVSISLLAMALQEIGVDAISLTGWQIEFKTNNAFGKARILDINRKTIEQHLKNDRVVIIAGFQGIDENRNITTLGRGGSDTSAVAIAAKIKADECLIFTDVQGVYTTDPRVVPSARRLKSITFEEMLEMSSLGSKVLQSRAVEFAGKYKVNLRVLSSFTNPDIPINIESQSGTLITFEEESNMEQAMVSGIAFNEDEAKVTVLGVPDRPGVAHKILAPVSDANIEVDVIVQNVGIDGTTDFSFTVHKNDLEKTLHALKDTANSLGAREIVGAENICKVGVVGVGMRSHVGVASKMFGALAEGEVNIQMISTSEIKITVVIDQEHTKRAVQLLHDAFTLEKNNNA